MREKEIYKMNTLEGSIHKMGTLDSYGDKILEKIAYKLHQLGEQHTYKKKRNIRRKIFRNILRFFLGGKYCAFNLGKIRETSSIY